MNPTVISTDGAPAAIGPYVQAMRVGGFVFTSGQIPLKPDGTMVEGGVAEQTRQVMENLKAVAAAAGVTLAQTVKATVFLKDMNSFAEFNAVFEEMFEGHKPARSTVEVARLPKDAQVEIELILAVDA
ncbi:RidA family protein [Paenibacillus sp.]|uniref:RidA family protein n=1 Tax=Paenibacillus sp. TaxID=58172 RepID=UPI002D44B2CD|nr:RidA family protein [Paenibacillus sp.]HZG55810.1 RidA family protein [Paenibacillus sp.]